MCAFWVEGSRTRRSLEPEVEFRSGVCGYTGSMLGIRYTFLGAWESTHLYLFVYLFVYLCERMLFLARVMWAIYRRCTAF